jgi:AcrR family transcriptional regulator
MDMKDLISSGVNRPGLNRPVGSVNSLETRPTSLYSQGVRQRSPSAAGRKAAPGVGERILNTASDLFYREGVRAVGIQRVIDEAGIAKASLYAHYASKDELVAACIDKRARAGRTRIETHLSDPSLDARGKLLRLFDLQLEWISSADFRGCPFLNASSEIADTSHPARAVTAEHRQWLHALVTRLTKEAGVDPPDAVAAVLGVLYDGAAASAQIDGNATAARHARWAAAQIIDSQIPARTTGARRHR